MIKVDESKLICVLHELVAHTDMNPPQIFDTIKTILEYLDVYNEENKNILDKQLMDIIQEGFFMWLEGCIKK